MASGPQAARRLWAPLSSLAPLLPKRPVLPLNPKHGAATVAATHAAWPAGKRRTWGSMYLWAANMKAVPPGEQQCGQRKGQDDGQQPGALTALLLRVLPAQLHSHPDCEQQDIWDKERFGFWIKPPRKNGRVGICGPCCSQRSC